MNVLLCDDDVEIVKTMKNYLDIYKDQGTEHFIKCVSDPDDLLIQIKINKYDIAFLDIEIGSVNGIDVAKALIENNPNCLIVFVTGYYEYVYDAFDIKAFQFLHKPIIRERFKDVYNKALKEYKKRQSLCIFNTTEGKTPFNPFNIKYVETYYQTVKIVTKKGSYYSNVKNCKTIKEALSEYDFIQIHQSFYVNMNSIRKIKNDHVILEDGEELPISFQRRQEVLEAFNRFIVRG